ncbi:hypothetical protein QQZ08_002553 [Neonectria magnoliae]|uniref:Uncharacterized protein n=1 Tax=Neonectria magnoliae TaxID=2732573 RepID=A0ABR1IBP9_9HYPO
MEPQHTIGDDAPGKKVLMLTNIELGQSNVFLATAHALLHLNPHVKVHLATFGGLEESVASVSEHARKTTPRAQPIVYHRIQGMSMREGIQDYIERNKIPSRAGYYFPESFSVPLNFSVTKRALRDSIPIFVPYTGSQLVEIVSSLISIIQEVNADLVVVDALMTAGLTALEHLRVKYICLSPNTIKDFAASAQPRGESFWKYPALFSGYSYPVPLHLVPLNIYFLLYMTYIFISDPDKKETEQYLQDNLGLELRTPVDLLRNRPGDLKIVVGSLPELDFKGILPDHVLPCGPILRSAPPVSKLDPELGEWLAKGPTLYINLGSMCQVDEQQMTEMACAIRILSDEFRKKKQSPNRPLQVLWKLKANRDVKVLEEGSKLRDAVGKEIEAGQVRIVDWAVAEPIAILKTGHVVCSVHHGGANSFNEAIV